MGLLILTSLATLTGAAVLTVTRGSWIPLLTLGGVGAAIGVGAGLHARRGRRAEVLRMDVHERGLVVRAGTRIRVVRWDTLESLTVDAVRKRRGPGHLRFAFQTAQGPCMVDAMPDQIEAPEALLLRVVEGARPSPLQLARDALELGAPAHFGPLAIHPLRGIQHPGGTRSWPSVGLVRLEEGMLTGAYQREEWLRIPVRQVPNAAVFVELLEGRAEAPVNATAWTRSFGSGPTLRGAYR